MQFAQGVAALAEAPEALGRALARTARHQDSVNGHALCFLREATNSRMALSTLGRRRGTRAI